MTQIRNIQAYNSDSYPDTEPPGAGMEPAISTSNLGIDLRNIRSMINEIVSSQGGNWFDALTGRDLNTVSADLLDLEDKRILCRVSELEDLIVGAAVDFFTLSAPSQTPTEDAAIGAGTTLGAVVAELAGGVGTGSASVVVSGQNALQPKNLLTIVNVATNDVIVDGGGNEVYGLLQIANGAVDGDPFDNAGNAAQVSFVVINGTRTGFDLTTAASNLTVQYAYVTRNTLDAIPEECFVPFTGFVDNSASVEVTLTNAYLNQGVTFAPLSTDITSQTNAVNQSWDVVNAAGANIVSFGVGAADGNVLVVIGDAAAATDSITRINGSDFDINVTGLSTIANGMVFEGTPSITIGDTDGLIESSGAVTIESNSGAVTLLSTTGGNVALTSADAIVGTATTTVSFSTATGVGADGGEIDLTSGDGDVAFAGGAVDVNAGVGGVGIAAVAPTVAGVGGAVTIDAGAGGAGVGTAVGGETGGDAAIGGAVTITAGDGGAAGAGAVDVAEPADGADVTLNAGDGGAGTGVSGNGSGANVVFVPGDAGVGGAGAGGSVGFVHVNSPSTTQSDTLLRITGLEQFDFFSGDVAPTHVADTGSVFVFDDGATGSWYLNTSAGGSGNTWTLFSTGAAETWAQTLASGNVSGGNDPVLSGGDTFRGVDGGAPTAMTIRGGDSSAAATAGAVVTIDGGIGNTTGAGGAVTMTGGVGGATGDGGLTTVAGGAGGATSGAGGGVNVTGGVAVDGSGGNVAVTGGDGGTTIGNGAGTASMTGGDAGAASASAGGAASVTGGDGDGAGAGGAVNVAGGVAGATGVGGAVGSTGGAGGATSGAGGAAALTGGVAVDGSGGNVSVTGGDGGTTIGNGAGTATMTGGAAGAASASAGGVADVIGGAGDGAGDGGATNVTGGVGGLTGAGGASTVAGGAGGATSGDGGDVLIDGGTVTEGDGGSVTVTGANGVGTDRDGGAIGLFAGDGTGTQDGANITLTPGEALGAGQTGYITIDGANAETERIVQITTTGTGGDSVDLFVAGLDPTIGGGVAAPVGSFLYRDNGNLGTTGSWYGKIGVADTAWELFVTGSVTADTWAQVLVQGADSGGTSPVMTTGDDIIGEDSAVATATGYTMRGGDHNGAAVGPFSGGPLIAKGGDSDASANGSAGGLLTLEGGEYTGTGGGLSAGGGVAIAGGQATVGGGLADGGFVTIDGGEGFEIGGPVTITAGRGQTAAGADAALIGGRGATDGGDVNITGGLTDGGNAADDGGAVNITSGGGTAAPYNTGAINILVPQVGPAGNIAGGSITIEAGNTGIRNVPGGDLHMSAGDSAGGGANRGGEVTITSGSQTGGAGGVGGSITNTLGDSTNSTPGVFVITGPQDEDEELATLTTAGAGGDSVQLFVGGFDPSTGAGTAAPVGSFMYRDNGNLGTTGSWFGKTGAANTAWSEFQVGTGDTSLSEAITLETATNFLATNSISWGQAADGQSVHFTGPGGAADTILEINALAAGDTVIVNGGLTVIGDTGAPGQTHSITGGAGAAGGDSGGGVTLTGGVGITSGTGGAMGSTGGAGGVTGAGGANSVVGGAGGGAAAGGATNVNGGVGGATGAGGLTTVAGGDGGATSGAGGGVAIDGGDATDGAGGSITVAAGSGGTTVGNVAGSVTVTGAAAGGGSLAAGGGVTVTAGAADTTAIGGEVDVNAGVGGVGIAAVAPTLAGVGGAVTIDAGVGGAGVGTAVVGETGGDAAIGGAVTITAGDGGAAGAGAVDVAEPADGADVTLNAGDGGAGTGVSGNGSGANVVFVPGSPGVGGAGAGGSVGFAHVNSPSTTQSDTLLRITGLEQFDFFSGTVTPTHTADTGSAFALDDGATGAWFINTSAGGSGTDWSEVFTENTRDFVQGVVNTSIGTSTDISNAAPAGNVTMDFGVFPTFPLTQAEMNVRTKIFINGLLQAAGTDVVRSGTQSTAFQSPTTALVSTDVIAIEQWST